MAQHYRAARGISTEIKFQQLIQIPKNLNTNIDSVTGTIQLSNAFGSVSIPIKLSNTINLYTYDSPYKDNKGTVEYFVDEDKEYRVFTNSKQLIVTPGLGLSFPDYPENSSDTLEPHVFIRKFISETQDEKFGGTFIFEGLSEDYFNLSGTPISGCGTEFLICINFDKSENRIQKSIQYDYIPNVTNQIDILNKLIDTCKNAEEYSNEQIDAYTKELDMLTTSSGLQTNIYQNENGNTVVSWVFEAPFESNMANYKEAGKNGIILKIKTKNKDFKLTKITLLNTSTGLEW